VIELRDTYTTGAAFYLNLENAIWSEYYKEDVVVQKEVDESGNVIGVVTAARVSDSELKIVISGTKINYPGSQIRIPLATKILGGEATVEIDPWDTIISASKHIFAVSNESGAYVEVGGDWRDYPMYNQGMIAPIRIEESFQGALGYGADKTISIEVDHPDLKFDLPSTDNIFLTRGFTGLKGVKIQYAKNMDASDNTKVIQVILPEDMETVKIGGIELRNLMIRSTVANPEYGDIYVTVSGPRVETKSGRVGVVENYSNKLKITEPTNLIGGQKSKVSFSLSEHLDDSLIPGRSVSLFFNGVYLSNDKVDQIAIKVKHNEGETKLLQLPTIKDKDGYVVGFQFIPTDLVNGQKDCFLFQDVEVYKPLASLGGASIEADGRAIGEKLLAEIMGNHTQPINVYLDKINIEKGITKINNKEISIMESINGAFKEGNLILSFLKDADIKFSTLPTVRTTGDLEVGELKITDGKLVIPIIKGSTTRSTIDIVGGDITLSNTSSYGKKVLYVDGDALTKDGCDIGDGMSYEYINIEQSKLKPPSSNSGSGGGGSSTKPSSPIEDQKLPKGTIATITNIINGTANLTVSQNTVKDFIKEAQAEAQAEAKKNGTEKDGISIEMKVDSKDDLVKNISAKLPKASIDEIIKEQVRELSISSEVGTINIDLETLKAIQSQVVGEVEISAKKVDNNILSEEIKEILGERPVYEFNITDPSGTKVTEFGKGKVSIVIPYTLGAEEKAENVVAYYIDAEGKLHEMIDSVYDKEMGSLYFTTNHFSKFAVGYKEDIEPDDMKRDTPAMGFADIETHWAREDIEFTMERGLFGGTAEGVFSPNMFMTRGMLVTVLGRVDQASLGYYINSRFTDVELDAYYMTSVEWATKMGIVNGVSSTEFAPNQALNREQLAVIIANYARVSGFELPELQTEYSFADQGAISGYAKTAVRKMQMAGLLSGRKDGSFDPKGTATRAEVSAVLKRFVELIEKK